MYIYICYAPFATNRSHRSPTAWPSHLELLEPGSIDNIRKMGSVARFTQYETILNRLFICKNTYIQFIFKNIPFMFGWHPIPMVGWIWYLLKAIPSPDAEQEGGLQHLGVHPFPLLPQCTTRHGIAPALYKGLVWYLLKAIHPLLLSFIYRHRGVPLMPAILSVILGVPRVLGSMCIFRSYLVCVKLLLWGSSLVVACPPLLRLIPTRRTESQLTWINITTQVGYTSRDVKSHWHISNYSTYCKDS